MIYIIVCRSSDLLQTTSRLQSYISQAFSSFNISIPCITGLNKTINTGHFSHFKDVSSLCHVVAGKLYKQTLINGWKYPHSLEASDVYTDQAGLWDSLAWCHLKRSIFPHSLRVRLMLHMCSRTALLFNSKLYQQIRRRQAQQAVNWHSWALSLNWWLVLKRLSSADMVWWEYQMEICFSLSIVLFFLFYWLLCWAKFLPPVVKIQVICRSFCGVDKTSTFGSLMKVNSRKAYALTVIGQYGCNVY